MSFLSPSDRETLTHALGTGADAVGVSLTDAQIEACIRYADLLLETNQHTNLTRIVEPHAVAIKHFADSLTLLRAVPDLADGAVVADVGTGAGFPGVVLKIVRPDLRLVLIDSLAKRLTFLGAVVADLNLANIALVHARAEEAGRNPVYRDACDLVVARAVAALPTLLEWCAPLVRPETGRFVALKTASADAEIEAARPAAALLRVRLENDLALTLPPVPGEEGGESPRRVLVYRKFAPTLVRYPRKPAEIKANPLRQ